MNKLGHLLLGELHRLLKYKILIFSIAVSLIWVVIIALTDENTAKTFVPYLVLMDAGLMSILLLSASFFFEKQEGSMQGIMVTPISLKVILLAKVISMILVALISFVLVVGSALIFHDFPIAVGELFLSTLLVVTSHTAIGYVLTLYSRDFMQTLTRVMLIMFLYLVPLILIPLEIVTEKWDFIFFIIPTYSSQVLFQGTIGSVPIWKSLVASGYLLLIPALLYPFIIFKRYEVVAMEG
ncbi:MAG: ABC transporter permease [Candidatus Izemoplasmatales bacterium]|jgi:fluoroquinolone transport system permease protein|nr:ABC transporter permease [Candidatus Izemoplasmatales bacterium]MDD4987950.1 ABC transporter permease [Candidatus Izemoplasmatales bacterium]MDD5601468.1 ABC transporter permease [Candidatus Izemoplasmatales bacterium]MDY0373373.1 ABC transporter permease [Candidatus Izemoplasmatales bacterium]NLF49211.1 ABC transporter permease [Acholeplasmataceae bacterium]